MLDTIQYYSTHKEEKPGIELGFRDVDAIMGGIKSGEMLVVGARPGLGKTAYLLTILHNKCFRESVPTLLFSLEMRTEQLLERLLSSYHSIPQWRIRNAKLDNKEIDLLYGSKGDFTKFPIRIYDQTDMDVNQISLLIQKSVAENGTKLVICLLYTSPSPRDRTRSRMPSSA